MRARGNGSTRPEYESASSASSGPPGYGSPKSRAPLSNASPGASSRVRPSTSYNPWSRIRTRCEWPPEAMRNTAGSGSALPTAALYIWPSRW